MSVKVLGISTSPRQNSNSDLLLRQALAGAESAGAEIEYISLRDLDIAPCIECNSCYKKGACIVDDDYQMLSSKMLDSDRLIFATPIFFMTVCAQAKALIDRCQCLWAHKYVLKQPLITTGRDRRAMVIAVGGTKSKKMFDSIRLTAKYFLDVLNMNYAVNLFVNKIDDPGQIKQHPSAVEEAFRLGRELTSTDTPPPEKPIDVELT
ncbi:MAG: flavodoxin family protein [Phycisphaerae bacterium]|nr:flavodoxin family protein [Phycisphaerae bacterium]NIP53900.1 flavodoxin family protein [Phycisphaerae bacterium]NIS53062.1 flavodoxin family protein [Phycisphaerae bacterium]NIU10583.1 flavodoxin family protein [Phycisphaerae bacterium]NIU58327.1 flavodoxin family protein [Phycisphaerae bacterium]